jgi:hypothetical protein
MIFNTEKALETEKNNTNTIEKRIVSIVQLESK